MKRQTRLHRSLVALVLAGALASGSTACRTDQRAGASEAAATDPASRPKARSAAARAMEEAGDDTSYARGSEADGGAVPTPKGKDWDGWRYRGDRGTCFYLVDRRCETSLAAACERAACEAGEVCATRGEAPVRVECRKK
ncbi:MAG: hypothetical protein IPL79_17795 [Myxococcales bacterium]|nr:hypothetical protein [Myxococcales bacterium]